MPAQSRQQRPHHFGQVLCIVAIGLGHLAGGRGEVSTLSRFEPGNPQTRQGAGLKHGLLIAARRLHYYSHVRSFLQVGHELGDARFRVLVT